MHIPEYSQIVSPLYLVTRKKKDFHWGPEQQQAFGQIKQEIAYAVALGPVRTGPDVKNVLYAASGSHGLSWSLWQKVPGMNRKWKAAVWSPTRQVAEATEGEGGSSQPAELKAVQLALDIAEREEWPRLYLYTDSWMVANALWGWLKRWKEANWMHGGKPIWAAEEWKDIATRVSPGCHKRKKEGLYPQQQEFSLLSHHESRRDQLAEEPSFFTVSRDRNNLNMRLNVHQELCFCRNGIHKLCCCYGLGSEHRHTPETASRSFPWALLPHKDGLELGLELELGSHPARGGSSPARQDGSQLVSSSDDRLSRQLHFAFPVCRNGGCDMGCEEEPVPLCVVFPA
ncbi:hypothetical protein DUI87_05682 [Hirundo rustica rustica]|uniref:RNase H type-1 domain-containing protein n=1 Tax=Hirundo rustica rustica TaxID=333673 RepID=A0A3M0KVD5_HIRRU|nr:hypothetical protein DUI87_05682 [Hirundo rustica rustica]